MNISFRYLILSFSSALFLASSGASLAATYTCPLTSTQNLATDTSPEGGTGTFALGSISGRLIEPGFTSAGVPTCSYLYDRSLLFTSYSATASSTCPTHSKGTTGGFIIATQAPSAGSPGFLATFKSPVVHADFKGTTLKCWYSPSAPFMFGVFKGAPKVDTSKCTISKNVITCP